MNARRKESRVSNAERNELATQNSLEDISFRNEGKIKTFSDEGKLRKFVARRPLIKKMGKRSSLYRKEMIRKGILKEGRKEGRKW